MYVYSFERLDIWPEIRKLVNEVYKVTKDFPKEEMFGIVNQIRRAVVSVSSNLAEGTSRTSSKDQAHFTQIAYSSLMEVLSQLIISYDLNFINEEQYHGFRDKIEAITPRLSRLRQSQLNSYSKH